MMRSSLLIAAAITAIFASAGCSRRSVVLVDMPERIDASFQAGASGYQDVLNALGPPADALPTQEGFALFYRSYDVSEANIRVTYQGGKLSYSFGDRLNKSLVVFFDTAGVLRSVGRRSDLLDLGYGAVVGHAGVEEPFYETRQYDAISRRHYQAARLTQQSAVLQRNLPNTDEAQDQRRNSERQGDEAETEGEDD